MDWDEPTKKPESVTVGDDLSNLGVAELEARITALRDEIDRVEAEAAKKRAQASAADALFGK